MTRVAPPPTFGPLAVVLSCALLCGCSRQPEPCQAPPDCDEQHECLAFRCVPRGMDPVPVDSERVVVLPLRLGSPREHDLPLEVALGPPAHSALYAAFDFPSAPCSRLDSAFLLLQPSNPGQSSPRPVEISVRRVTERWSARGLREGDIPDEGLPEARGLVQPPVAARIDITHVVCNALETKQRSHGLVVRSLDDALPLRIATGLGSEQAPRIELYLRRSARAAAPSNTAEHD